MTVYFVGAGPGAPELMTARGSELLARADVTVGDAEGLTATPAERAAKLVDLARAHATVVRVVEGDPSEHARVVAEIAEVAAAGVPYEIVPGITCVAALTAFTGMGGGAATVAAVRLDGADAPAGSKLSWSKLAWAADLIVAHTDAEGVAEAATQLLAEGRNPATPALVATELTRPTQRTRVGTLADIATRARGLKAPKLLLAVGDALVGVKLPWFTARPLFGRRVLVTRTREQASGTAQLLREAGACPVLFPTIVLHPPPEPARLEAAVRALAAEGRASEAKGYAWVAFTSANSVEATWQEVARQGRDARAFGRAKIAAIGPGTAAALRPYGLVPDVVAKELRGEGLASELLAAMGADAPLAGARVLIPRAREAREVLPDTLRAAGCDVDVVAVYETRPPEPAALLELTKLLEQKALDAALFTSSSTVTNLLDLLGDRASELLSGVVLASIGPVTTATLEGRGLKADVTAAAYTVPGLVAALEGFFRALRTP